MVPKNLGLKLMDRSALKPIVYVQTQVAIRAQSKANIFSRYVSLLDITTASPLPLQRPRTVSSFFQFFSAPPSALISSKRKIATMRVRHSSTRTNTKRRSESSRMVAVLMKRITQRTTLSMRMNHRKSTRAKTTGLWMFTTVSRALYGVFIFLLLIRGSMANLFWRRHTIWQLFNRKLECSTIGWIHLTTSRMITVQSSEGLESPARRLTVWKKR